VRGILFSLNQLNHIGDRVPFRFTQSRKVMENKKPPSLAVYQKFGLSFLSVRLPLFHRHLAGIAKVKIKVKAHESH
jgi:hypothetical protein